VDVDSGLEMFGLDVPPDQLEQVRTALLEATNLERNRQGASDTELMRLYCYQLFRAACVSDSLLIWSAKTASMDADASIEVQLLCGAGLQTTIDYLASNSSKQGTEALARIRASQEAGDFDDFSPEAYGAQLETYYT
jgi:hypothetical protein